MPLQDMISIIQKNQMKSECYFAKCHSALRTSSNTNNNTVNCTQTPSPSNPPANKTRYINEQQSCISFCK